MYWIKVKGPAQTRLGRSEVNSDLRSELSLGHRYCESWFSLVLVLLYLAVDISSSLSSGKVSSLVTYVAMLCLLLKISEVYASSNSGI